MIVFLDPAKDLQSEALVESKGLTHLTVVIEDNHKGNGWTVMPPLSVANREYASFYDYEVFLDELPNEFLSLSELLYLDISKLGIKQLPDLAKFPNLQRLDISFNPISIKDELQNLSKLPGLQVLNIQGCDFTTDDIVLLKQTLSSATILHLFEQMPIDFFTEKPIITSPDDKLKLELLNSIYNHYPVGLPHLNKVSQQYLNYKSVLDRSIEGIQNKFKGEAWAALLDGLATKSDQSIVRNSFIGHPSRSIFIPLGEQRSDSTVEKKKVILDLSLLTKHYTIYFESLITFNEYKTTQGRPLAKRIFYGKQNASSSELALLAMLLEEVPQYYPEYRFVPHDLLMSSMINGAVPHGQEHETAHNATSMYVLLFGQRALDNVSILE